MSWRIHLANQAIRSLHILPSKPPTLAVWTKRTRVNFYDLNNGRLLDEHIIDSAPNAKRNSDTWQTFIGKLTGPDPAYYLPYLRVRKTDMYATDDGKLRLYRQNDDALYIETDGAEEKMDLLGGKRLISVDLDRALGTIVGLDEACQLHVYQQNIRVGAFEIGLQANPDLRPAVVVSRGGGNIYATDGRRLIAADASGNVLKEREMHYFIGRMTCSPGGGMVITTDMESGVIRVYHGDGLVLTHQKFAIDLVAAANQVQLLADLPPIGTAISALAGYNRGIFAFAMSGVVCVTNVEQMDEVPRPKALL